MSITALLKVVPMVLKVAPRLGKKLLGSPKKATAMATKIASAVGASSVEEAIELISNPDVDTDTPLSILESMQFKGPDFEFLKSKKVFVTSTFSLAILILMYIKPEAVSQNIGVVQMLIGLVTVSVGGQAVIDSKGK